MKTMKMHSHKIRVYWYKKYQAKTNDIKKGRAKYKNKEKNSGYSLSVFSKFSLANVLDIDSKTPINFNFSFSQTKMYIKVDGILKSQSTRQ